MTKAIRNNRGFSLLEIIVTLVLVAGMAVVAGLGISAGVRSFLSARDNMATAQKGQLALTRLVKELTGISAVSSASATSLNFTSIKQGVAQDHTLNWTGATLLLDNIVLTDGLDAGAGLSLGYYDVYDGARYTNWSAARRLIEITLTMRGADNIQSVFTARVAPRNL